MQPENFKVMPHTNMEFPGVDTIRVWKTDSLEPDINTYAAVTESSFHVGLYVDIGTDGWFKNLNITCDD